MKQGANSAVRFTSFATIQQYMLDWTKPASGKLSSVSTFGVGAAAGLITVCECIL
jgi:solute carrier family 25 citrate transporter 1